MLATIGYPRRSFCQSESGPKTCGTIIADWSANTGVRPVIFLKGAIFQPASTGDGGGSGSESRYGSAGVPRPMRPLRAEVSCVPCCWVDGAIQR